jgi:hypothetical protein
LDPEDDRGIDFDLLSEVVKRFGEDEALKLAFIAAVEEMSDDLSTMTINDDYKPYASVGLGIGTFLECTTLILCLGFKKPCPSCRHRFRYYGI